MKTIYFFLFPLIAWAQICTFLPPENWQPAQPKDLSEHVQIGFIGKGSSEFHPSINLATEEIDCSLKEYVKAVKQIHSTQPNTTWRDLGKIEMKAGAGRLTEIQTSSNWGSIQMLQAIYVRGETAYILTAAVLKEDFISLKDQLLASLRSFELADDLASAIHSDALRAEFAAFSATLQSATNKEEKWKELQDFVVKKAGSMGGYWQFLALKEGYSKIFSKPTPSETVE